MKEIITIIPAHNEEKRVGEVIDKIRQFCPDSDILVIDDGSLDNTAKTARSHGAEVISLPFNLGYGSALETGYIYAYKNNYKYIVQIDADGQHEPKCIYDLINAVKKDTADIVIGSRYLKDCGYKTSFVRKVGSNIFSKVASLFLKKKITDPTSGFRAINRKALEFFVKKFYPSDYPDADLLILLNRSGFRITEIPIVMYSSQKDKESMHAGIFRPIYYIFKMNLSILMIYLRKKI